MPSIKMYADVCQGTPLEHQCIFATTSITGVVAKGFKRYSFIVQFPDPTRAINLPDRAVSRPVEEEE